MQNRRLQIVDVDFVFDDAETELVRLADRALYASKDNGRDQVRRYAPSSAADELAAR